ncbi:MAG: hypothetical protein ACO3P9_09765 [Phycisphaerales bacterium]
MRLLRALRRLCDAAPQLREDRRRRAVRRRWIALGVAAAISIAVNLALLVAFDGLWSGSVARPKASPVELVELPELPEPFDEPPPATPAETSFDAPSTLPEFAPLPLAAAPAEIALETATAVVAPGVGGPALDSAGTGGTTFFGVSARGRRIGYVVDVSASMEGGGRLWVALDELKRSLSALPDHTWFHVALFSNDVVVPPFQPGWLRATDENLERMTGWLDREVSTGGGTRPGGAFQRLFGLDPPPDAIFFLTDGEVPPDTPSLVQRLNQRLQRAVVNTVAFGSEAGRAPLERIASDSSGAFRFVPVGGRR